MASRSACEPRGASEAPNEEQGHDEWPPGEPASRGRPARLGTSNKATPAADTSGREVSLRAEGGERSSERGTRSRPPRELREVGLAALEVRPLALLRFLAHVIEQRRVAGELLHACLSIERGVEGRLEQPQRQRRV